MSRKARQTSKIQSEAFVAVGSNIEPRKNILRALTTLAKYVTISDISNFYRSAAMQRPDQEDFFNGVVKILTRCLPRELKFDVLRQIESQLGRVRTADKHAARTIDLDLILYDDVTVNEPDLVLPDPAIGVHPFVGVPLQEVGPELVLPPARLQLSDVKSMLDARSLQPEREFTHMLRRKILEQAPTFP